jgi:hypothetical protein
MQLDDLEKRERLSTEEIIQITSKLAFGELLHCRVPITPAIKLEVYLNNKAEDRGYVATALVVQNRSYMRRPLFLRIHHTNIQRAVIEGRDGGDACLSVKDIVNIFELDDSVRWQILGLFNREEDVEKPDWM